MRVLCENHAKCTLTPALSRRTGRGRTASLLRCSLLGLRDARVRLRQREPRADDRLPLGALAVLDVRRGDERVVGETLEAGVAAVAAGVAVQQLHFVLPVAAGDHVL